MHAPEARCKARADADMACRATACMHLFCTLRGTGVASRARDLYGADCTSRMTGCISGQGSVVLLCSLCCSTTLAILGTAKADDPFCTQLWFCP